MNSLSCDEVLERIGTGSQPGADETLSIEAHLAGCADCRQTAALLAALAAEPEPVPTGLEDRVVRAVRANRRPIRRWRPANLAIAASIILALVSTAVLNSRSESDPQSSRSEPAVAGGTGVGAVAAQPLIGGMPALHELSVDELEALLSELGS